MKHLKIYSEIFLWTGKISIVIWFGLLIFRYLIPVSNVSWIGRYETGVFLFAVRNFLLIMSPFSLIIGHALKKIYIELNKINNKL